MIEILKKRVLNGEELTFNEVLELSSTLDKEDLYSAANLIRDFFLGDIIELCSITNAKSGNCLQDCKWCSQSVYSKSNIDYYEIIKDEDAVNDAIVNSSQGVNRHSLVTSGRSVDNNSLNKLISIYKQISKKSSVKLCASMGLVTKAQLSRLKNEANVSCYHCNIETAPSYFSELVSKHTIEEKIYTIKCAQEVGLKVCSGVIIGMGETMSQRIEMAFLLRRLNITSVPINILQPIKGTALENMPPLSEEEIITSIALFRFVLPSANLRLAGGRVQTKNFQHRMLKAGISALLTGNYLTSTGLTINEDIEIITNAGLKIDNGN
ncbi:biotin synthase BioB [Marinilabiliaceae bacterium ANBcel2]|nr:biotin synthase BioB [Marinilabiliaceae bacterium ANBcel2]